MSTYSAPISSQIVPRRGGAAWLSLPRWVQILGFLFLHAPLAFAIQAVPAFGVVHALGSLALGLFYAFFDKTPNRAVQVAAYIVGAETLWRITYVPIFYEFGKYAICLIFIVSAINHLNLRKLPASPFVYFALLVPSVFLQVDRKLISFNVSGPLSLAIATIFFSRIQLTEPRLYRLLLTMIAPFVGVAAIATFSTATASDEIRFDYAQTLKVTAGGHLPTHVAAVLGLGVVVLALYLLHHRPNKIMTLSLAGLGAWLCVQSVLTFSRGGMSLAIGTLAVASFYSLGIRRVRDRLMLGGALVGALAVVLVIPWLHAFTGGAVSQRFTETRTSGRYDLVMADIDGFMQHPVLGLGPGGSMDHHTKFGKYQYRPHTEYSRLLAEHGMFGLVSLFVLAAMSWPRFVRRRGRSSSTIYSASFTAWALAFMLYESMRLAAVSFLFGLASAVVLSRRDLLVLRLKAQQQEMSMYAQDERLILSDAHISVHNSSPGYQRV